MACLGRKDRKVIRYEMVPPSVSHASDNVDKYMLQRHHVDQSDSKEIELTSCHGVGVDFGLS